MKGKKSNAINIARISGIKIKDSILSM